VRERLRLLIAGGFYYSGLVKLALWLKQRRGRRLIILNYHQAGGNLQAHLRYLRRHYRILHLEDALSELYAPPRKRQDPRMPLVITFDDGYLDNYVYAFPIAEEWRIPITIFLIPGFIESGRYFWWLAARYLVQHTSVEKVTIDGRTYHPAQTRERGALAQAIDARLRYAQSVTERETLLDQLQIELGVSLPERSREGMDDPTLPLSWAEIGEMEQSGLVSFGAHTMHHPVLACITDVAELGNEIEECRRVLEARLKQPVRMFAYPIGKPEHIGLPALKAVKAAGYAWALTTIEAVNTPYTDPYLLGRLPGDITQHWLVMAAELAGLLGIVSRVKRQKARISLVRLNRGIGHILFNLLACLFLPRKLLGMACAPFGPESDQKRL
jgi:peptidoglycan/xylan/chitin deacetylase (PgdA/CDA1 family)